MVNVEQWDEKRANNVLCVTVHVFTPKDNPTLLMYYMGTEYHPDAKGLKGIDTTPRMCERVEDAVAAATTVAAKNGINLVLVDDNRSE